MVFAPGMLVACDVLDVKFIAAMHSHLIFGLSLSTGPICLALA